MTHKPAWNSKAVPNGRPCTSAIAPVEPAVHHVFSPVSVSPSYFTCTVHEELCLRVPSDKTYVSMSPQTRVGYNCVWAGLRAPVSLSSSLQEYILPGLVGMFSRIQTSPPGSSACSTSQNRGWRGHCSVGGMGELEQCQPVLRSASGKWISRLPLSFMNRQTQTRADL